MKNLVIQTLETKGVLGQIRAKLRSTVFKIVDDQDQRTNLPMGCGLKWENPLLYKIRDTNMGGLISEMVREFMEYLKMDYSLSVFIPECSISPERLKRDEILARLGVNSGVIGADLPIIYFMIYYFIDSMQKNPENVYQTMKNMPGSEVEKVSDEIIMQNLYNYQTNINGDDHFNNQMNNMDEKKLDENVIENENIQKADPNEDNSNRISNMKSNFDNFDDDEIGKMKSYEFEDVRIILRLLLERDIFNIWFLY